MSLKQEIETWVEALAHYDNNEFDQAIIAFERIADTSKILFNCGVIFATLGEHEKAVDFYIRAIKLDNYLAVAYFQQGVSNFLLGDFEEALANFNDTLLYLRGNNNIDYEQLGLKFKLFSCEVLFNRGLCYIYLRQVEQGMQDLRYAAQEKVVPDHDVINEAIKEQAEGYTVFSIPVGIIYRPNEAKVKNLKQKNYLGKARLVAATDRDNAFTGFTGAEMQKKTEAAKDDRPEEKLSFAASNLVRPDLKSRYRQQSEPPLSRTVFPPTPPPETDKPMSPTSSRSKIPTRAESVRAGPKPKPLDLSVAGFATPASSASGSSRYSAPRAQSEDTRGRRMRDGPQRTMSERVSGGGRARRSQRDDNGYPDDVYDMYGRGSRGGSGREVYISEEEGDEDEDEYVASYDEADFEMVSKAPSKRVSKRKSGPEVRKIRVKVHAEDTRYVMIAAGVGFGEFVDQIRTKFGIRTSFKIKVKDEGDMITMADQEDLDLAMQMAKTDARKERSEMGKMEIWVQAV
ncbi:hypothetical protein EJ06DRAFT_538894 [Trichodelitschia bisporula]|uniref:PB1 domain-containing protein n=1 Tax=Trichodelitschia bisporula TaxID=703511 RepID=A0A6G1HR81_9PEZI|nr:hypothetical protein EJ06DRAFT_538894 [Trichodelitschia bisporula]